LGGGSSDAASVLLALNRLWRLGWPRARLAEIGQSLGADVPFFVGGQNALVRGIGQRLTPVTLPASWLALAFPRVHVSTRDIFAAPELTRSTPSAKIDVFSESYGRNDLAGVTAARFPAVAEALDALTREGRAARMTGSGACVFAACATESEAQQALQSLPPHIDGPANDFRRRHRMHGPFLLYGGRIDPGKGCEELLEYFQAFLHDGGDASLMLMGVKLMPLPDDPRVRFAGLLPDQERLHALQAATVVVVPSPYESLSLLALEAFAVGTPVLANARAEVLVDHCRQSNAGLFYADRWEFAEALRLLLKDAPLRERMGVNGRAYVEKHYRWDVIISKYERMFTRLRGGSGAAVSQSRREDQPSPAPASSGRASGRSSRDRFRRGRMS
jgi:glycosyltransferase involved in cell wall biosynthesis